MDDRVTNPVLCRGDAMTMTADRNTTSHSRAAAVALVVALACLGAREAVPASQYLVATDASELRVLAYRAGPLARLGHNHVVTTHALSGSISLGEATEESRVRLEFPVASLMVDEPAARTAAGPAFEGEIPPGDVTATRKNMLGPELLEADSYPTVRIESRAVEGGLPNVVVSALVTVRGRQYPLEVPVSINTFDGGLVAVGRLRVAHSEIGLEPFTVALGSLRVADELQVAFRIVARQESDARRIPAINR